MHTCACDAVCMCGGGQEREWVFLCVYVCAWEIACVHMYVNISAMPVNTRIHAPFGSSKSRLVLVSPTLWEDIECAP